MAKHLTAAFVSDMEEKILKGVWKPGDYLPTSRALATQTGHSRSVINSGIASLIGHGYLQSVPRRGVMVKDWRRSGSLSVVNNMARYSLLEPGIVMSLIDSYNMMAKLSVNTAARNISSKEIGELKECLSNFVNTPDDAPRMMAEAAYDIYHLLSVTTGNEIYPLFFSSIREPLIEMLRAYFKDPVVRPMFIGAHSTIFRNIEKGNIEEAVTALKKYQEFMEKYAPKIIETVGMPWSPSK